MILSAFISVHQRPIMRKNHQPYRRAVQLSVLLLLLAVPLLSLFKFDLVQGTLCSVGTKKVEVTCALGALQSMLANREVYIPLLFSASFFILLALLLGRVFCSWVCPQHVASETGDKGRRFILKKDVKGSPDSPAGYRKGRAIFLSILATGLIATFTFGVPVICYICPIGIICRQFIGGTFLYKIGGEAIIIGLIVAADFAAARRGWCKYICPLGAFYSLFSNRYSLRVKRDTAKCVECGMCQESCPMGDSPMQGRIGKTCTNCAICIDRCPEGALGFKSGLPSE